MKRHKTTRLSLGFTLVEVLVAISIMAAAAAYAVPYMISRVEIARAHKAADEAKGWLEAGIAYYAANGAWPADANALVAAGYMQSSDLNNPWDGTYSLAVNGSQLQVSTTFSKFPEIGKERLPLSAVSGSTVTARVVAPGTEAAHTRLLNRYGDGGNNRMYASLEMGGNNINQANTISLNRQSDGAANLGAVSYPDSSAGLKISTGSSSDPITLWTNGSEKVRVANDGNVGIGTTTPGVPLHVYKNQASWNRLANFYNDNASGRPYIEIGYSATDGGLTLGYVNNGGANYGFLSHTGLDPTTGAGVIVTSTGDVGIGTSAPNSKLRVEGDIAGAKFKDTSDFSYYVDPGNSGISANLLGEVHAGAIQLNTVVTAGVGCSPNGLQARDSNGGLLSCKSGVWSSGGGVGVLGAWTSLSDGTNYYASTDGFVVARRHNLQYGSCVGYTDSSSSPGTVVAQESGYNGEDVGNITYPVRKGDYFRTNGCTYTRWIALGS